MRNNKKNTNNKTKKNRGVVIIGLIHASWCGHCQALKPEWKKMKNNVMKTPSYRRGAYKFMEIEDSDNAKDSKINAINSRLNGKKLEANGYPTIFKVKGGALDYYEGQRQSNELQKWFLGSTGPLPEYGNGYNNQNMFQRMFGGKTRKNKSAKKIKN